MIVRGKYRLGFGLSMALGLTSAVAYAAVQPENILPSPAASPTVTPAPTAMPAPAPTIPVQVPIDEPKISWSVDDARSLLGVIEGIDADGLIPADYQPAALRTAIAGGAGAALDAQASKSFAWLIEDMRDGRTRMESRLQWFVVDTDVEKSPTSAVMAKALASRDIPGAVADLAPTAPDYATLKGLLAVTPRTEKAKRNLIRINMDRWRWLQRDLGKFYLLTNVPEFQLRLTVDNSIIRSYRTIVGKVGKTATPQLAEVVEGVVFNPTWTVPQSIVKGEGLGARLYGNPAQAAREGYKVTKSKDGTYTVVQQPGPKNALGFVKLDMPNEHAIFIHDTPSRGLFGNAYRALSHGCVRTERAIELGMTMGILGAGKSTDEMVGIVKSGVYTRVPMTKTFPIYIMYFTMATDINGKMGTFADLYQRDAPVLASFAAPRKPWDGKRKSTEKVIKLDNPL
ncbi:MULTISPECIES: L,D-transpeptidase family protein [unclassified Novosphingobium]|uniref:L,D-transpeptidase family protein n=1 Tax=unclassified Novosphingobium TaxID=2644732 RepID=UPI000EEDA9C8|nr:MULTISPECIES: L,D-transpeptidase family protein [unclassified Novosphingobium]HCF24048.1 L,D-transpeptidase [Novosphingobium sp.]HQV04441.1 L,D-transpeptidase family protein [Novosphingobium sp.]